MSPMGASLHDGTHLADAENSLSPALHAGLPAGRQARVIDLTSIGALSVGLAMDATAVAATRGAIASRVGAREFALVALYFGGFQAGMPLAGWALGALIGRYVEAYGHFIAFGLLAVLGGKMLLEARSNDDDEAPEGADAFSHRVMAALAVATSIDAFAVGVTLPLLKAPMALSLTCIGLTTAGLSSLGLWLGRRAGALVGKKLDALGGVVLILLGVKLLLEGLSRGS